MAKSQQKLLFPDTATETTISEEASSTFVNNMTLPVHRWFRYSAGFSATWVEREIVAAQVLGPVRVFDPFAGSATTLIAAETTGAESFGVDAHPFVSRIAAAKLHWRSDPAAYLKRIKEVRKAAKSLTPQITGFADVIYKCYDTEILENLDVLRQAVEKLDDRTPAAELTWLTLVAILRKTSKAGTAQWQYVLPKKQKCNVQDPLDAFDACSRMFHRDMLEGQSLDSPHAQFLQSDARTCAGVPDNWANLVITSPPYPNNYDYADATRLEMSFLREVSGWGDLQETVRRHLVRSCSQHVPERSNKLEEILADPVLAPIRDELSDVCQQLAEIRLTKGGKKTYHLMVACYFRDLAAVWHALRRVCQTDSNICFVIGDSAPYGIYVPVIPWLGALALAAGFKTYRFEKTRERNVKWKNRKHRVPLQEGRLWVEG